SSPIPDPRQMGVGNVDDELAGLVMACMDKDREKRPTFEELAPALLRVHKRLGGGLPRLTRPIFTLPPGVSAVPGRATVALTSPPPPARPRAPAPAPVALTSPTGIEEPEPVARRRWPGLLAIALTLGAVATAIYYFMRQ